MMYSSSVELSCPPERAVPLLKQALEHDGLELWREWDMTLFRRTSDGRDPDQLLSLRSAEVRRAVRDHDPEFARQVSCRLRIRASGRGRSVVEFNEPVSLTLGTRNAAIIQALGHTSAALHAGIEQVQRELAGVPA